MFNASIRYHSGQLFCDDVCLADIITQVGTPVYIYSLKRVLENYETVRSAFSSLNAQVHYSAKANANLAILRALVNAGCGIDTVSAGEIYRALKAGAPAEKIVFAGVGKAMSELYYAVEQDVGWFNVENVKEAEFLNSIAMTSLKTVRVALRLNPNVQASTHPKIATGHGSAKFGLSAESIQALYARRAQLPALRFEGIHVHIGSQLHDLEATVAAVRAAVELAKTMPTVNTIDIGGGFPVAYSSEDELPNVRVFADALALILEGYTVVLEPGRSIVADAGMLVTRVLYVKDQGGEHLVVVDAGMTDLIRPALYDAHHAIVPLSQPNDHQALNLSQIVGPVCESADVLGRNIPLPALTTYDCLAVLTTGAYGMVMASNYNARVRPPEVVVEPDGGSWRVARRRETWADLIALEQ